MEVKLKEFVHPQMDILFLALNAPEKSNENESWLSGSKSFWNILFKAGLIISEIKHPIGADKIVFGGQSINYNKSIFGITDLNRKIVDKVSKNVPTSKEQVNRIISILDSTDTKVLCIIFGKVAKAFKREKYINRFPTNNRIREYGCVGNYKDTKIYEMPFHNASIKNKHLYYQKLLVEL